MPSIGPFEAILILVAIIVLFGVGKLPEVGGALGRGIREFRKASSGEDETPAAKKEENAQKPT